MIPFLLIAGFPLLLAVGFSALYMGAFALGRGKDRTAVAWVERAGFLFYPLFLTIPFAAAALAVSGYGGSLSAARLGVRLPVLTGTPLLDALVAAVAGGITGFLLFRSELLVARHLSRVIRHPSSVIRHASSVTRGVVVRTLEGGSGRRAVSPVPLAPALILALGVVLAEEFLWRGYLPSFLQATWSLSLPTALVLAAASFGLNHYYFGLRSVLFKAFAGLVWGAMAALTGSLLAPVLSHYTFECLAWTRLCTGRRDSSRVTRHASRVTRHAS